MENGTVDVAQRQRRGGLAVLYASGVEHFLNTQRKS